MLKSTDFSHMLKSTDLPIPNLTHTQLLATKGLLIEAFIFILLLVSLILIQFLVFITHAFSASRCCKNGCCCDGENHGCGHEYHRKARRERIRKLILSVYFFPLTLWILVFISSYYLNEWPHFGGGKIIFNTFDTSITFWYIQNFLILWGHSFVDRLTIGINLSINEFLLFLSRRGRRERDREVALIRVRPIFDPFPVHCYFLPERVISIFCYRLVFSFDSIASSSHLLYPFAIDMKLVDNSS